MFSLLMKCGQRLSGEDIHDVPESGATGHIVASKTKGGPLPNERSVFVSANETEIFHNLRNTP